ncbi:hypothetical protein BpHYR1_000833 [Brachionus plicatilis]|uniref:Homeodomain-only protein n=1 Tax=Brachionus plicatilis TaxID=10195 RepID=A0A3M7P4D1_BRAPC|nr:hypothetical protein BpHYR1_000833 [Brachionus plicatilis]
MVELSSASISFESSTPSTNLIRIKHLFLIFVRQFDAEEYKLFCHYMKNLLNQPVKDPFELLDNIVNDIQSSGFYDSSDQEDSSVINEYNYYSKDTNSDDDSVYDEHKSKISRLSSKVDAELEKKYQSNNTITSQEKKHLAKKLGLTERQVQNWFNKRKTIEDTNEKILQDNENLDKRKSSNKEARKSSLDEPNEEKENGSFVSEKKENTEQVKPRRRGRPRLSETLSNDKESSSRRSNVRRSSIVDKDNLKESSSPPPKKVCRGYSDEQLKKLDEFFLDDNHAEQSSLGLIEKETKLSEYLIKKWFKLKRESLKQNSSVPKSVVEEKSQSESLDKEESRINEDKVENSMESKDNESDSEILKNVPPDAIEELEKTFEKTPVLRPLDKKALSLRLGLKTTDIDRWFNSKRKLKEKIV